MDLIPTYAPAADFSFQGQKLLLTYPTHVDKQLTVSTIQAIASLTFKFVRVAHETGEDGYAHSHVLIDFGKSFKCRNARRFDLKAGTVNAVGTIGKNGNTRAVLPSDVLHPNWRPVKTITHWKHCTRYLAKQDPENADLTEEKDLVSSVWNAPTLQDALAANVKKFTDVGGIMQLYAARPSTVDRTLRDPSPWQQFVIDLVETEPHPRHVHWIFDPVGGCGKSKLADHLVSLRKAYVVENVGRHSDFATIITNAVNNGWDGRCFIFDLPRSLDGRDSIYGPIEAVKTGRVTATKYSGGTVFLPSATTHVFVFANFAPDITKLSHIGSGSRWQIYTVDTQALSLIGLGQDMQPNGKIFPSAEAAVPPAGAADAALVADAPVEKTRSPGFVEIPPLSDEEIQELHELFAGQTGL